MSSFQGPDLLNTETDREQRRREKSKPSGSGLPVVQIERIASAQKTRYDSNNRQETLKRIDIFICIHLTFGPLLHQQQHQSLSLETFFI